MLVGAEESVTEPQPEDRPRPGGAGLPFGRRPYFRALAADYDGTLADGSVARETLDAVCRARAAGTRVILVTGRIMAELRSVFPDVDEHVDAIVAENGAVLVIGNGARPLAPRVDPRVGEGLAHHGIRHRHGDVLVALAGADEPVALDVVRSLGLDCQLLRNRSELMILPAGITKGSGLLAALDELGLSPHNTIAVGDAENDHALLDVCEVGAAVANAVDSLKGHADLVLEQPDGQGVTDLLTGPLFSGRSHLHPKRWEVELGADDRGGRVTLPASQLNVAICGDTGQGKSYLTGLVCEQLVGLGYSLVVVDPEGDHVGLGDLWPVVVNGGRDGRLAEPDEVVRLLHHRDASVVVDLSNLDAGSRAAYLARLAGEIEARRIATGLPQWVVVDEAHGPFGHSGSAMGVFDPAAKGHLLVTWRPQDLSVDALASLDAVVALCSDCPSGAIVDLTAAVADVPRAEIARLLTRPPGQAVLAGRAPLPRGVLFTPALRRTAHLRHEHKYDQWGIELSRRFYFRREPDVTTGAVAANLLDLEAELSRCDRGVLRHHCPRHDFSRWVAGVVHDQTLADELARVESRLPRAAPQAVAEEVRLALIAALHARRTR